MKSIKTLFTQIEDIFPYYLALYNDEGQMVASTENISDDRQQDKIIYRFCLVDGTTFFLHSQEPLKEESIKLLQLMINQSLHNMNSYGKGQIVKLMAEGNFDSKILKRAEQLLLRTKDYYTLIWIEFTGDDELKALSRVIVESFKGYKQITVVPITDGILLFIEGEETKESLLEKGKRIRAIVNSELFIDVSIGISNKYTKLNDLYNAVMETKKSVEIGNALYPGKRLYITEDLQVEKLLYMISQSDRKKIYIELFHKEFFDTMEEEIYKTMDVFLEKDLNLGDTARELYIHRNTLAYRLDKIQKESGLDLRRFEDAMLYKISLLLKKSLD